MRGTDGGATLNEMLAILGYHTTPVVLRNGETRVGRKHVWCGPHMVMENAHASDVWAWLKVTYPVPTVAIVAAADLISNHCEAASMDAAFDGGEFSGPSHQRMLFDALERLAARHDCHPDELHEAAWAFIDEQGQVSA